MYYLPVLLNPLVNAVFNCPEPTNSPLKRIFQQIAEQPFVLLVPRSFDLIQSQNEQGTTYQDLCYSPEFVSSHILLVGRRDGSLKESAGARHSQYSTLNGKVIGFRWQDSRLITQQGFSNRKTIKVIESQILPNFNEYLRGDTRYLILYIDQPLEGIRTTIPQLQCFDHSKRSKLNPEDATKKDDVDQLAQFTKVIYNDSVWTQRFDTFFKEFRKQIALLDLPPHSMFTSFADQVIEDLQASPLAKEINDIRVLVYSYMERELYYDIWSKMNTYFESSETETSKLKSLSPVHFMNMDAQQRQFDDFSLNFVTRIEPNIEAAISIFKEMSRTQTFEQKLTVLLQTLQVLAGDLVQNKNLSDTLNSLSLKSSSKVLIDADTLISVFVCVICRSQVTHLKSHLHYMKHYWNREDSVSFGFGGYGLSTFEAAVFYFDDLRSSHMLEDLISINTSLENTLHEITLEDEYKYSDFEQQPIKVRKYISWYRSIKGESLLNLCIRHKRNDLLFNILTKYEDLFPLEDLLEDQTTGGATLLSQSFKYENYEAATMLIKILKRNCTENELNEYLNRADKYGRIFAHYINDKTEIIEEVNGCINWTLRDKKGQTPLFTIFRCYDQPNYRITTSKILEFAKSWYSMNGMQFNSADHEDLKGDSLLHILKENIGILLELDLINVNKRNNSGLTPLMNYIKYKRIDNLKSILADRRVNINVCIQPSLTSCFDLTKEFEIIHILGMKGINGTLFKRAFIHTTFKKRSHLGVHITVTDTSRTKYTTTPVTLKTIRGILRAILRKRHISFLPITFLIKTLLEFDKGEIRELQRHELHKVMLLMTVTFDILLNMGEIQHTTMTDENTMQVWLLASKKSHEESSSSSDPYHNLEPEEINMIQSFLKFNVSELRNTKLTVGILKKLTAFSQLKLRDVRDTFTRLHQLFNHYSAENFDQRLMYETFYPIMPETEIDSRAIFYYQFLEEITTRLLSYMNSLLNEHLPNWWKCYGEMTSQTRIYAKAFPRVDKESINPGFLGHFLDTQRSKSEQRMHSHINELTSKLAKTGNDIKTKHELLAEELSFYMTIKSRISKETLGEEWLDNKLASLKSHLGCLASYLS